MNPTGTEAREHGHYFHDVRHLTFIDVYRVCQLFGVEHPALQHALKKVIAAGKRGAKSAEQDAREAIDSLERFLEMKVEDGPSSSKTSEPIPDAVHISAGWANGLKPSNSAELEDPHFELRKTWREGQLWQYRNPGMPWHDFVDMSTRRPMQPAWRKGVEYRRHPEDKNPEPAPPSDPHAALKAIYRPGMRWRWKRNGENDWNNWRKNGDAPGWFCENQYEIHPDDLPKSPDTDGWITVPDDLMEMPEGLKPDDLLSVRFRSGFYGHDGRAMLWNWKVPHDRYNRIVAYRTIKPAE